jgi:hypothetical protein
MVDLHGLYVDEALEYAKEFQSALLGNNKVVRFIVGMFFYASLKQSCDGGFSPTS